MEVERIQQEERQEAEVTARLHKPTLAAGGVALLLFLLMITRGARRLHRSPSYRRGPIDAANASLGADGVVVTPADLQPTEGMGHGAHFDVPISSPTSPNSFYQEPGCPELDNPPPGVRYIQIRNNCKQTIWPGMIPSDAVRPPGNSWAWGPGDCKTLEVPSSLPALRVWGRTGCDGAMRCTTGSCYTDQFGGCLSSGETPCTLWEASFQPFCTPEPTAGFGPDFYDQSLVDGYNLPMSVHVSQGYNVGREPPDFSCHHPAANVFDPTQCPFELRVYGDQMPGTNTPLTSFNGRAVETSPCYTRPTAPGCAAKVVGCRSLCKALDQGWIAHYIANVQGPRSVVDPMVLRPDGESIQWSQQFVQGNDDNLDDLGQAPAWGAFRGGVYGSQGGKMRNLVCCDDMFQCSPYQPNDVPGGCPFQYACPTLGAADAASPFHGSWWWRNDPWPQADENVRRSSMLPDWPMPTRGGNYAQIYKESSPSAYSWMFNDASSTFTCCAKDGGGGPSYIITFCP